MVKATTNNGVQIRYRTHISKRGHTYLRRTKYRRGSEGSWKKVTS